MISVTDHCDPEAFSPLEIEGVICFTRLFLEAVFRNSHKRVIVNIHVKERRDAIYPETGGFTNHKGRGLFEVVIFKADRKAMLTTLSHELIHVKQFMEDGFIVDYANNAVYWEGRFYLALSEVVRMHREKNEEVYAMLPWEHEANLSMLAVIELVTDRLIVLCRNDPALKNYLQLSMAESTYEAA